MKSGTRSRPAPLGRRKPSVAARIRPFWILASLAAVALAAVAIWFVRAPAFRIAHVGVSVPLGSPVTSDEVRRAAAIGPGSNLWLLDTGAIALRIEAIPYVDTALVDRTQVPRPQVALSITVRRPSACLRAADRVVTIDATARVLQDGCAMPAAPRISAGTAALPAPGGSISDPDLGRLLADAKILSDANLGIRSLGRDRWGGLEAVDASGVRLMFGSDDDLAQKAALIGPVRAGVGSSRIIRAIDLRSPGTPIVDFR
jgi:cell division protein FtsQ